MIKMTDWEIWMACVHPPVQKYASAEYINNPSNWGPPFPKHRVMMDRLTVDELLLLYLRVDTNSPSGLSWRRSLIGTTGPASRIKEGTPALTTVMTTTQKYEASKYSYYGGKLFYKGMAAHRVVYFLMSGEWPEVVDHIDGNSFNNAPGNLRRSTHVKNQQNRKSGQTKGFFWNGSARKFYVRVAGVHVAQVDDMLTARAEYVRHYVDKYSHLPSPD